MCSNSFTWSDSCGIFPSYSMVTWVTKCSRQLCCCVCSYRFGIPVAERTSGSSEMPVDLSADATLRTFWSLLFILRQALMTRKEVEPVRQPLHPLNSANSEREAEPLIPNGDALCRCQFCHLACCRVGEPHTLHRCKR